MNMKTSIKYQQGAALIVASVILIALSLLAVSTIDITTLETKMVNLAEDRTTAFQAAEAALKHAEECLGNAADYVAAQNECGATSTVPDPVTERSDWWDKAKEYKFEDAFGTTDLHFLSEQPRFTITVENSDDVNENVTYLITAEGRGRSEFSRALVQSKYKQAFYNVINMKGHWPMNMVMLFSDGGGAMCFSDACQAYLFGWLDPPREGPVTLNVEMSGPLGLPAFGNMFMIMDFAPGDKTMGDMMVDMMGMPITMMKFMVNGMMTGMIDGMAGESGGLTEIFVKPMAMMMKIPSTMMDAMITAMNQTIMGPMMKFMEQMAGGMMKVGGKMMGGMMDLMMGSNSVTIRNLNIKMNGMMNMAGMMDMPGEETHVCVDQRGMMNMNMFMDMGMYGMSFDVKNRKAKQYDKNNPRDYNNPPNYDKKSDDTTTTTINEQYLSNQLASFDASTLFTPETTTDIFSQQKYIQYAGLFDKTKKKLKKTGKKAANTGQKVINKVFGINKKEEKETSTTMDIPMMPPWMMDPKKCASGCPGSANDTYRIKMENYAMFGKFEMGMNFAGIGDAAGNDTYIVGTSRGIKENKVNFQMGMDMIMTMDMLGNDAYRIYTGGTDNNFISDMADMGNNMDMAMVMDMSPSANDLHFGKNPTGNQPPLVCKDNSENCDRFDIRTDFGIQIPLISAIFPTDGYHGVWPGFGPKLLPPIGWQKDNRIRSFIGSMMPMHHSTPTSEIPNEITRCYQGPERLSWREVWE